MQIHATCNQWSSQRSRHILRVRPCGQAKQFIYTWLRHTEFASYLVFFSLAFTVTTLARIQDAEIASPESPQEKKVFAALELAKMAADADQPEISFEAVKRIALTGPVISKVDLGGLLSSPQQNSSMGFNLNSNQATPQQKAASRVAAKMIAVSDLWNKKGFDASQAYQVWFEHVFPVDSPNVINMHSQSMSSTDRNSYNSFSMTPNAIKAPLKTGAQCLIEWAAKTEKISAVEQELAKRLAQPGNAEFGWLFKIWIADANKSTSDVYEAILAESSQKWPLKS